MTDVRTEGQLSRQLTGQKDNYEDSRIVVRTEGKL